MVYYVSANKATLCLSMIIYQVLTDLLSPASKIRSLYRHLYGEDSSKPLGLNLYNYVNFLVSTSICIFFA